MPNTLSLVISLLALAVSATTAWLTFFRAGSLRMTRPTIIYFGPDGGERGGSKVYLRTLLYSTSKRGQLIESVHVTVHRGESRQTFNVWVYGEETLRRGSGLFVGENGVATNHHFLLPRDGVKFAFHAGDYHLRVFAKLVGAATILELDSIRLTVTETQAKKLEEEYTGLYFDWGADTQAYHGSAQQKPAQRLPDLLRDGAG